MHRGHSYRYLQGFGLVAALFLLVALVSCPMRKAIQAHTDIVWAKPLNISRATSCVYVAPTEATATKSRLYHAIGVSRDWICVLPFFSRPLVRQTFLLHRTNYVLRALYLRYRRLKIPLT